MCQSHSAAACTHQAVIGCVMKCQAPWTSRCFDHWPRPRLQANGSPQSNPTNGRESTRNGATTTISSSCCAMCAENKTSPRGCNGDSSATQRRIHPAQKQLFCFHETPCAAVAPLA